MADKCWVFNYVSPDGRQGVIRGYPTRKEAEAQRKDIHKGALVSKVLPMENGKDRWTLETELHGNNVATLAFETRKDAVQFRKRLDPMTKWVGMPKKKKVTGGCRKV